MTNAIIDAQKIADEYSFQTVIKGIRSLKVAGHIEERENDYSSEFYLINGKGEINLGDALSVAAEHGAEITIAFKFNIPVDLSGESK